MKLSVFVGISVDGFLARKNGEFDFLSPAGDVPHGFEEFYASVDALVMGRNTFETMLTLGPWPFEKKRVVVLSSRPVDLSPARDGVVEQMGGAPEEIVAKLAADGVQHVYLDGGVTIQGFLRAGFVHRIIVTRVPVLIGEGIPLFGALPHDVQLRHVRTQSYSTGLVQTEYEVVP